MFSIDQSTGQVQLKIEMENFEFRGMSKIKFTKVDGFRKNFEKAKIELKFNFPEIFMQGTDIILLTPPTILKGMLIYNFCL